MPQIPPLSDELRAFLQQRQQPNGSCQILQVNDNPETRKAVEALTSKSQGGGGHELISAEHVYDPNRTIIVVDLGARGTEDSHWRDDDEALKSKILDVIPSVDEYSPDACGVVVLSTDIGDPFIENLAGILHKSVRSADGMGAITQFRSGDVFFYCYKTISESIAGNPAHNPESTLCIPRAIPMDAITPPISPLENYKDWIMNSRESPFKIQMDRERSRRMYGLELEMTSISNERQNARVLKSRLCSDNLFTISEEIEDEEYEEYQENICCSGGHRDVEISSGNHTTMVIEHGNNDLSSERHDDWIQRVIAVTSTQTPCDYPVILSTCGVNSEDARRIARESCRSVIFSPDTVIIKLLLDGDCSVWTENDQGFFIAHTDDTIEAYRESLFLSRSPRLDMALQQYQGNFEEEGEDIPQLPANFPIFPGVEKHHHPPIDVNAYLQEIAQQLLQQQQYFAQLQQQQQGARSAAQPQPQQCNSDLSGGIGRGYGRPR